MGRSATAKKKVLKHLRFLYYAKNTCDRYGSKPPPTFILDEGIEVSGHKHLQAHFTIEEITR